MRVADDIHIWAETYNRDLKDVFDIQEEISQDDILIRAKQGYFSPYLIAVVYAGLEDKDKVFAWLEKAFDERDTHNWCIKLEPKFDELHSDPRWTNLMAKMGLAD